MTIPLETDPDESARLDRLREWVWSSVSADTPLDRADPGLALRVVQALLDDGIGPDETVKLHALGTVLGDALAELTGAVWVVVDDEWGRDAALRFGGPDDLLFPVTMIAKRVEGHEDVDVIDLAQGVIRQVLDLRR